MQAALYSNVACCIFVAFRSDDEADFVVLVLINSVANDKVFCQVPLVLRSRNILLHVTATHVRDH